MLISAIISLQALPLLKVITIHSLVIRTAEPLRLLLFFLLFLLLLTMPMHLSYNPRPFVNDSCLLGRLVA
jgi:hypothetical protein